MSSGFPCLLAFLLLLATGHRSYAQPLPVPDHIIILIEENETNTRVICSGCNSYAPWLNALATDSNAAYFSNMQSVDHPSQPNYLEMFCGYNPGWPGYCEGGTQGDDSILGWPFTSVNLASQLLQAGLSFKTYSEDLPYAGYEGKTYAPAYARKHNPVTNWQGTGTNQVPDSLNQPFTAFPDSLHYNLLPTLCYVVPDLNNDMHNGTGDTSITKADNWFHKYFNSLLPWVMAHNSLLVVTWDESNTLSCTVNPIPTIFYGPMVKGGSYTQQASSYSELRTYEDMYHLNQYGGYCGAAADSSPITYCWKAVSGINSPDETVSALKVYPNPSNSVITFDGEKMDRSASEIIITDFTGRQVAVVKLPASSKLNVNTGDYASGIYFYRLTESNGATRSGKFVVTH